MSRSELWQCIVPSNVSRSLVAYLSLGFFSSFRDSIFAPASIPWQEAHPTANDYALPLPLHHHPHHPQPLAPPLLTPAALPTAVATAVALPVSLPAVAASLPVTLPAATPLADPMTPSLDNHADLSVHILPDAPSSHQPLLYPISTVCFVRWVVAVVW